MAISTDPTDPNFGLETDPTHPDFGLPAAPATPAPAQSIAEKYGTGGDPTETIQNFLKTPSIEKNVLEAGVEAAGQLAKPLAQAAQELTPAIGGVKAISDVVSGKSTAPDFSGVQTLGGLLTPLFGAAQGIKQGAEIAAGVPVEEAIPESQVLKQAETTPAFSAERFLAGFSLLGQMGMAAGLARGLTPKPTTLTDTLFPKPPIDLEASRALWRETPQPETAAANEALTRLEQFPKPVEFPSQENVPIQENETTKIQPNIVPTVPTGETGKYTIENEITFPSGRKQAGIVIRDGPQSDPNAQIIASREPNGEVQVINANVKPELQGTGAGIDLYEKLISEAGDSQVVSDTSVKESAARVWEGLTRRGYTIEKNPTATFSTELNSWESTDQKPVFRVTDKPTNYTIDDNIAELRTRYDRTSAKAESNYQEATPSANRANRAAQTLALKRLAEAFYEKHGGRTNENMVKFSQYLQEPVTQPTQGEPNAIEPSNAQVEAGNAPQRVQEGTQGNVPATGSSDNVIGEAQGTAAQGEVPGAEAQRGQPSEAEVAAQPVTVNPDEPRTTGIAQRITNVPAGETMSTQEFADRGRTLIDQGANPQAVSAKIQSSKEISSDSLAVLRAHEENLTKAVYEAGDRAQSSPNDPAVQQEFQDALKARNDWRTDHVKPAQTIWAELGHGQQGDTDIDTGTVTGLRMAFSDVKGRDATPAEQTKLTKIADQTQQVNTAVDEAKSKYDATVTKATAGRAPVTADQLQQTFADRVATGGKVNLSQPEIADLWKYAKDNYIDKGVISLDDTIHGISLDTGLPPDQVAEALTKPKAIRQITNDIYSQMAARRNIVNAAKDYINSRDEPTWKKVARAVWETPFSLAIYGHGTVGGITHAGANIFRPSGWSSYWPDFVNQAKFFAKPSIHEAAMQGLVRDANFVTAKRGGLANDPNLTYTDYGAYAKFFGLQGGRRGFDALKTMRQSMFNSMWDKVPDSIKSDPATAKDMATNYSNIINHATGVISNSDRGFLATAARAGSPVAFAAKLEASRWARVIGDPIKTLDTYANWGQATAGEKAAAIVRTKHAAEFGAVFLGTLGLNQAILSASGSKDSINFTDPSKSDWLKHKIAGHNVAVDGGLLAPIRLLARVTYDTLVRPRKELRGDTRTTAAIKDVGQYAIGKASPSVGIAKEALTGESFQGQLLPWSRDTTKKPKMTWTEYAASHGPIPLAGGIKEAYDSMRERGMSEPDAKTFLRGLAAFGSELTGARVTPITEPAPKRSQNR